MSLAEIGQSHDVNAWRNHRMHSQSGYYWDTKITQNSIDVLNIFTILAVQSIGLKTIMDAWYIGTASSVIWNQHHFVEVAQHTRTHTRCMHALIGVHFYIIRHTHFEKQHALRTHVRYFLFSKINMREWLTTSQDSTSKTSNDRNIPEKRSSFEISSKNRVKIEFNYSHMNAFRLDEYSF